jgi:hypothetical protein
MPPHLPPELLSHILALANEDQFPLQRLNIRSRFQRVCRDWCAAVDTRTDIRIGTLWAQDGTLMAPRRKGDTRGEEWQGGGPRVKSIYWGEGDSGPRWHEVVILLLERVPNLEALEIAS